jgi:hypothetical protein
LNGGPWLTIDGNKVDLIDRDLGDVKRWIVDAEEGDFEIEGEVGHVAEIASYVPVRELALGRVLAGELPRPRFPPKLWQTAPVALVLDGR